MLNRNVSFLRARRNPVAIPRRHGVALALAAAVLAAAAALATAFAVAPPGLVFAVTGTGLLVAAASMAVIAWAAPPGVRLIFWDFAGILALFALGAALMGEPEPAVALLERDRI
jgi:hypothetical protein